MSTIQHVFVLSYSIENDQDFETLAFSRRSVAQAYADSLKENFPEADILPVIKVWVHRGDEQQYSVRGKVFIVGYSAFSRYEDARRFADSVQAPLPLASLHVITGSIEDNAEALGLNL